MKKILFLSALLLAGAPLSAQFQKGDWQISAGYGHDFTKTKLYDHVDGMKENADIDRFFVGAEYFLSDRLSVGVSPYWRKTRDFYEGAWLGVWEDTPFLLVNTNKHLIRDIGLDVFAQYYQPVFRNFYFTLRGYMGATLFDYKIRQTLSIYHGVDDHYTGDTDEPTEMPSLDQPFVSDKNQTMFTVGLTPGLSYCLSDHRLGLHLRFLPISYQIDSKGNTTGYHKITDPYLVTEENGSSRILFFEPDETARFRRKHDLGVGLLSFSLAAGWKF